MRPHTREQADSTSTVGRITKWLGQILARPSVRAARLEGNRGPLVRKPMADPSKDDAAVHVAVLTDLHLQTARYPGGRPRFNQKARRAILDMLSLKPDLILVVGDIVNRGLPEEYVLARQLLAPVRQEGIPLVLSMGNHEYYNPRLDNAEARSLFLREFRLNRVYGNLVMGPFHFVALSPEYRAGSWRDRDWARLTEEQIRWFDEVLTEHSAKQTFVFLHQPLNDTVEQSQYVDWIARTAQTDQLLAVAAKHKQIVAWFSGHTHAPLKQAGQLVKKYGITFVGGASTFYANEILPRPTNRLGWNFPHRIDFRANQNRYFIATDHEVIIRARDHARRQWISELDHVIPLAPRK